MYRHTDVKYFPLGEEMLDAMIEDLKKGKKMYLPGLFYYQ